MTAKSALVIVRDTREKAGYLFDAVAPPPVVKVRGLRTGDYSLEGYEDAVAVERKSIVDAYGTFTNGRKRWERELERMRTLEFAAVVIEADWLTIVRDPPWRSGASPKAIFASIVAWTQRFGVHFFTCPNRAFAEKMTYRILERFYNDRNS